MEIQINKVSDCQMELSVEVPPERWTEVVEDTFNEFRKSVKIDGFRRGKVPVGMVKKMYGPAIEAEAAEKAVEMFYKEALDKEDIHAIAPGEIKDVKLGKDEPFSFKAVVEVMPNLEITGFDNMSTFLEKIEIASDDIDAGMEVLREDYATVKPHDGAVEDGCIVIGDIQEIDSSGVPILTHNWKDISLEIGKSMFGPEADEMLLGKNTGETVLITAAAPATEKGEPVESRYNIEIKTINIKEKPELNDEFAKKLNDKFEGMGDLRDEMMKIMTDRANNRAKVKMFSRLVDHLIENNRVDVPPSMIEWYLDRMVADTKQQGREIDEKKFRENYHNSATRNMKWHLIRKHLIDVNELSSTEEDINKEIEEISSQGGGDIEILKTHFKQESHRARLKDDIEEKKVLDLLESKATITEQKVAYKDFIGEESR